MNLTTTIESIQKQLGVTIDGKVGPETWNAIMQKVSGDAAAARRLPATVSTIAASTTSQHFSLRFYARGLVHAPQAVGIEIKVITGTRSYAEQDALYAKGRTSPDTDKVTNAKGGHSNL